MNILVCVSKTPETTSKISFKNDNTEYNADGINFIMNPYDEWYALVRACELVETHGGSITILTVGDASSDIIIRKALAIGGDKAVRIDMAPSDSYITAANIAAHASANTYDLIFVGKETIDYNGSEVGAMVAEILGLPYISYATKFETTGEQHTITREIEGGLEICGVHGPVVISSAKGLAEQRIPNMKGIMMAKSKSLEVVAPSNSESRVKTVKFTLPQVKSGVKLIDPENMDELVHLLHTEAKVI
jgi:electron transfer flavoprotein beta subunit